MLKKYWCSIVKQDEIFFYLLNINIEVITAESLEVLVHVTVRSDSTKAAFKKNIPFEKNYLKWVIPDGQKLSRWSQIENMLITFKNEAFSVKESVDIYLEMAIICLENVQLLKDDNIKGD